MKKLLVLLLALAMVFSMIACASKTEAPKDETPAETPKEETPAEAPASGDKEEVTLYVYQQDIDAIDAWNELIANFTAEYPYITVELMDSQENYFNTILATGDMPDIINPAMSEVAKAMIDAGLIQDISGTEAYKHMSQSYIDAETYNGVCLGVPQGAAFSCMFYNMNILKEAGWDELPVNRDELLQCCEDVKAAGYDVLTLAGDKTTTCFMLWECILANTTAKELGSGAAYEEAFKDGTLDFSANADAIQLLADVSAYIMPGSTANTEDDVVSAMASGNVAMCLAGNWSAGNIVGAVEAAGGVCGANLPPFNASGEDTWISVSPESVQAMSAVDEGEAHNEARVLLYEYIWQPENYKILQNARGVVPVIDNMTDDQIVLDDCIAALVSDVAAAGCVSMGFNLWHAEFSSVACTALNDVYSGASTAEAAAATMTEQLKVAHLNMD